MHEFSLGDRLRAFRKEKILTQQELASLLSTSAGYISEIEKGKKMPGSDLLISLKHAFPDTDLDFLLVGETRAAMSVGGGALDTALLSSAIEVVEAALTETGREMLPHKKAELVSAIYELYADTGRQVDKERVLRLIKTAA